MRALIALLLILHAASAEGTTYYTNDDGAHGTGCATGSPYSNIATPAATVAAGMACLAAGDTLLVRAGTYAEVFRNPTLASGTSWTNKVRIAAYPDGCASTCESVTLQIGAFQSGFGAFYMGGTAYKYIEFDGININSPEANAISILSHYDAPISHIRWQNAKIVGCATGTNECFGGGGVISPGWTCTGVGNDCATEAATDPACCWEFKHLEVYIAQVPQAGGFVPAHYAFYVAGPQALIEYCDVHDTMTGGIQLFNTPLGQGGSVNNSIVRNNTIHDVLRSDRNQMWGVLTGRQGVQIYNNVFYNINNTDFTSATTGTAGVILFASAGTYAEVYNNTFYNINGSGVMVSGSGGGTGSKIINNIVYMYTVDGINVPGAAQITTNTTDGTNPNFVNITAHDFHLTSSSTVARNTGTDLSPTFNTDKDGVTRPQESVFDMGAFEFTNLGSLPGTPTDFVPANLATGVVLNPTLSWTSTNTTSYDVKLGVFIGVVGSTVTDAFNRANNTDIGATWDSGYTSYTNAQIVGNRVRGTSTSVDSVEKNTTTLTPNQWASITIPTISSSGVIGVRVLLRVSSPSTFNGYELGALVGIPDGTTSWIARVDNGIETALKTSSSVTWGPGDALLAKVEESTLTLYRTPSGGAQSQILQITDPTYTTGGVGIMIYADTLANAELDDFAAGNVGPLYVQNQTGMTYQPGTLAATTSYFWQIIARNAAGLTAGPVIQFTTQGNPTPPAPAGLRLRVR